MEFPVIKRGSYVLINTPDMVIHNGTTQTIERETHPDSEYLKELERHLRSFDDVVKYAPNQTYIGNMTPDQLSNRKRPWYNESVEGAERFGKYGEIMPQDEFYGLIKLSDSFDLVKLEKGFTERIKESFSKHPLLNSRVNDIKDGEDLDAIKGLIDSNVAEGLYENSNLVG
jgi:hypothetical protein